MLKEIFEVRENYQIPDALLKALLADSEKTVEIIKQKGLFGKKSLDINYFQTEHGDRKELKQDFTPESICRIVAELTDGGTYLDVCAGTGSLGIYSFDKAETVYFEEYSERTIPFLLLNLAFNNINAYVFHKDVLSRKVFHKYRLTVGEKYARVKEINEDIGDYCKVGNVVMNPPYSLKWDSRAYRDDIRFSGYALPPNSRADYAFILHGLYALAEGGVLVAVVPYGLLFRGGTEGEIRQKLIDDNILDAVIGLPDKLFLYTGIPVCLMVFRKARERDDVLFIDSSKEFEKYGKQNILLNSHIEKIISVYKCSLSADKYSRSVSKEEIIGNGYNLNIPRYVDTSVEEELPDLAEIMGRLAEIDEEERKTKAELLSIVSELTTENPNLKKGIEATVKRYEKHSGSEAVGHSRSGEGEKWENLQIGERVFSAECGRGGQYSFTVGE